MDDTHQHVIIILENGFAACGICRSIVLYGCPCCYCLLQFKGANHRCPCASKTYEFKVEDEGLGPDMENANDWDTINHRQCIYL